MDGRVVPEAYGRVTALALDPIEKKPLNRFYPGSYIVSVGGYGCNLACPFCQNHDISLSEYRATGLADTGFMRRTAQGDEGYAAREDIFPRYEIYSPDELADICLRYKDNGNIGLAFTYNEPTLLPEFIADTAKLIRKEGMKTVLVTNGSATDETLDKLLPLTDAMNIDLKSFDRDYYRRVLHGDLDTTLHFIERAVAACHVEVTTLIIPGDNDSDEEMREIAAWLANLGASVGRDIPLHISRFFPRSAYSDRAPTDVTRVYELADIARKHLRYVYEGNV